MEILAYVANGLLYAGLAVYFWRTRWVTAVADGSGGGVAPSARSEHYLVLLPLASFGITVALSFIAWGIVLARYLLPELRRQPRADAMQPLILLHCFGQRVAAEKQNGVGTPYIPPMTHRLKCRIDPEQSP